MKTKTCINCNKILNNRQKKYCSRNCQDEYQSEQFIQQWKLGQTSGCCKSGELSDYIRHYLLKKVNYKCQKCGWSEMNPVTKRIPLEIHHVDGDYRNCKEDNLEVLCPNCHSLTPNFGSLNKEGRGELSSRKKYCVDCGCPVSQNALRCVDCERKKRILMITSTKKISRDELKNMIRTKSFVEIGMLFDVTDNAIRKWCKFYKLPFRKKDIDTYTDDEWNKL